MGWKITLSAAFVAIFTTFSGFMSTADAGNRGYWVCWTNKWTGANKCARLPSNYRITGVSRPYCQKYRYFCSKARSSFRLNRRTMRCLSMYTSTSTMGLGGTATVYTRVYR